MARFFFENAVSGDSFELTGTPPFDVSGLLPDGTYNVSALSEVAPTQLVIENTMPSVAETGMDAHWLLGPDAESLSDLKTGSTLTPGPAGAGATFEGNAVRIQGIGAGYVSEFDETADFTLCMVMRRTNTPSILGGTRIPANGSPGWTAFTISNDDLNITRNGGTSPNVDGALPSDYFFFGVSISAAGNCVYFRGDRGGSLVSELSEARGALAPLPQALGGVHYNSLFNNDFRCAEFMIATTFTNATGMEDIYQRSILRMAERSISLI